MKGTFTTAPRKLVLLDDDEASIARKPRQPTFNTSAKHPNLHTIFPRFLEDGTPYVSPSQIRKINVCGADYQFTYLLGRGSSGSIASERGDVGHTAMEHAIARLQRGEKPTPKEVAQDANRIAAARFTTSEILDGLRDAHKANVAEIATSIQQASEAVWSWFKDQNYQIIQVEDQLVYLFEFPHPNVQCECGSTTINVGVMGYPDVEFLTPDGKYVILDWKFPGTAPSRNLEATEAAGYDVYEIDRSHAHALLTYADARITNGQPVDEVWAAYGSSTKTKGGKVVVIPVKVTEEALAWARTISRDAIETLLRGKFVPNPFTLPYTCRGCDHKQECPASALRLEQGLAPPIAP